MKSKTPETPRNMTDKPTDSAEATDGRLPAHDCSASKKFERCHDCGGDKRGVWHPVGCTTLGSFRRCSRCNGSGIEPVDSSQDEKRLASADENLNNTEK